MSLPPPDHGSFNPDRRVSGRRGYLHCRVPGCRVTMGNARSMADHESCRHVKCSCGWVGTSHRGHVGQRRRYGFPEGDHRIVIADMGSLMHEVGPWLLPVELLGRAQEGMSRLSLTERGRWPVPTP